MAGKKANANVNTKANGNTKVNPNAEPETKKIGRDLILLAAMLLVGVGILVYILLTQKEGATVEISVGGEVIEELPLNKDTTYVIEGKGDGHNYLTIEGGEAWLTEADCPDGICVYMGKISHNNESIICLPHEVVIWVKDEDGVNGSASVDGVAGGPQ